MSELLKSFKCQGCGADTAWIETKGKRHLINRKPKKMFVLDSFDRFIAAKLVNCYESHFATCPDADKFRKPKEEK